MVRAHLFSLLQISSLTWSESSHRRPPLMDILQTLVCLLFPFPQALGQVGHSGEEQLVHVDHETPEQSQSTSQFSHSLEGDIVIYSLQFCSLLLTLCVQHRVALCRQVQCIFASSCDVLSFCHMCPIWSTQKKNLKEKINIKFRFVH